MREISTIYITRLGSLAEMGIFKEHLISGVSAPDDVIRYCNEMSVMDKMTPFAITRYFKFVELKNEPNDKV